MNKKELEKVGKEVAKKRGRPKGSGGNTRKDLSWSGNDKLKPGDNARFLRHALTSLNMPPIDIHDSEQVAERINWYFLHCENDDMKPTVTGLSNALGIDRTTFYRWGTGDSKAGGTENGNLIKRARAVLEELWEDYMLNGKINPVSGIFLGKNHFGYTDKQEVVVTPSSPLGEQTDPEELRNRYIDSLPEELPPSEN